MVTHIYLFKRSTAPIIEFRTLTINQSTNQFENENWNLTSSAVKKLERQRGKYLKRKLRKISTLIDFLLRCCSRQKSNFTRRPLFRADSEHILEFVPSATEHRSANPRLSARSTSKSARAYFRFSPNLGRLKNKRDAIRILHYLQLFGCFLIGV